MAHGSIPEGLLVCHRCDTPACVRPDHLFLGTPVQNTRDMHEKGRAARQGAPGEQNSHHKLLDEQVISIRIRFDQGETIRFLAAEFGLHVSAISSIVNGRTWKHLGGPTRPRGQIGRRPMRKVA
jgi:transcription initiation factor TFIIIB Brf1 subunit/transcription initiation factor TFIIB